MANFESGVKTYITATCEVVVKFPVDWKNNPDISCNQCKFFSRNNGVCQLTKEISEYPLRYVGSNCPLILKEKEESENV